MSTMPRREVEQWALAVIAVRDTLSPDRLVRRGEVAEMCGVHPTSADRIMRWADMMGARGEALPGITMCVVARAVKAQREQYKERVQAAIEARAEQDRQAESARKERARRYARAARDLARIRAAIQAPPPPADYTLDRTEVHLMPVASSCPNVRSIPKPNHTKTLGSSRAGFAHVLIALAELRYRPTLGAELQRFANVRPWVLGHMVHRGLLYVDKNGRYEMTIAGLVLHTIASGPEAWHRPTATVSAWQVVLRRIREGCRRMDEVVKKNSATIIPRYQRQMIRAGLIRVRDGEAYLTEYGWQWARIDLAIQG